MLIVVAEWKERFRALWLDLSENLIAVPTSIGYGASFEALPRSWAC